MRVELLALIYEKGNETPFGWTRTTDSVSNAVHLVDTDFKEYAAHCKTEYEVDEEFELTDRNGNVAFKGDFAFLRELLKIEEDTRRAWSDETNEKFLEQYLYEPRTWLIQEWYDETGDRAIKGLFNGTQREASDYCQCHKMEGVFTSYHLPKILN